MEDLAKTDSGGEAAPTCAEANLDKKNPDVLGIDCKSNT